MTAAARENQQYGQCAQRRRRSVWPSVQSDQSSLCAQWVANDQYFFMRTATTDQAGRMPSLVWVFPGCTGDFVSFVLLRCIWLANSLKKSSLLVIMLPLIIVCCYRVSTYYFAQAWTLCNYFVLQPDILQKNRVYTVYLDSLSEDVHSIRRYIFALASVSFHIPIFHIAY